MTPAGEDEPAYGVAEFTADTDPKLQYVVDTNWDLIGYKDREWYLRHDSRWLKNRIHDHWSTHDIQRCGDGRLD